MRPYFCMKRPAHDLGRMRGQHELDPQRADRLVQRVARHAGRGQPRERFIDGSGLRRGGRIALIGAPASHAVVLLRDVREVQEVRERPGDRQGLGNGHRRQFERQLVQGSLPLTRPSSRFRSVAHPLDALEEGVPLLVAQRLAEQRAEQPHVIPQRLVRIVRRMRRLGFDWRMSRRRIGELVHDLVPPRWACPRQRLAVAQGFSPAYGPGKPQGLRYICMLGDRGGQ